MTTPIGRRIAVNPIPYWSKAGKTKEVFEEAFADFAKIGYNAVKVDVPDGMEVQEYADWTGSYGLAPAISLFSSPFDETIDITKEVERAKRFAGAQAGARSGPDHDLFHGHPRQDGSARGRRRLQPRPARSRHRELRDCLPGAPHQGRVPRPSQPPPRWLGSFGGRSYQELTATKRLWCEPGRGVVDFDAVRKALPEDYDGDFMIEIDESSVDSRFESHRIAYQWAQLNLPA